MNIESDVLAKADLVLINANIITLNPSQPSATAIAVKRGRIIKVGSNEEIGKLIGKKTTVIWLRGKTVIPGLIDTHIHLVDFAKVLSWIDLENTKSIFEMQQCLSEHVKKTPSGKWIIGRGWDENNFAEKRLPTCFDLDAVSPGNPVVFYHKSGNMCLVNSKAAELAGILWQTDLRDKCANRKEKISEFTGILQGDAMSQLWRVIPEPEEEELLKATELAIKRIIEAGVTSIHWIVLSDKEAKMLQKFCKKSKMNLRVYMIIPATLIETPLFSELKKTCKGSRIKVGGAVIFADGYLAARTAALYQAYYDKPETEGKMLLTQEELNSLAIKVQNAGLQLIIHAMGDMAVDAALTAIETAKCACGKNLRSRIEQAAVLNQELIERIGRQEVIVSVQPNVISSEFSMWSAVEGLGVNRARWLFPINTLLKKGVCVIGGSDCPMEPLNPLLGIKSAVTREFFTEERTSVDDALRMYTVNAAYAVFEENLKGTIEPGKLADLTVLSDNPLTVPPEEIVKISVELTIIGGKVVYKNNTA
ncbi:MAG: amidohydrolase [Candidatus Bathyarchaeia archaeon]